MYGLMPGMPYSCYVGDRLGETFKFDVSMDEQSGKNVIGDDPS